MFSFSPSMNETLAIIVSALCLAYCVFIFSSSAILMSRYQGGRSPAWVYVAWRLTKWPALAGIIGYSTLVYFYATADPALIPMLLLGTGMGLRTWWVLRNVGDDDDTMKKLRDRLKARVEQFGSKLVVVPEPA